MKQRTLRGAVSRLGPAPRGLQVVRRRLINQGTFPSEILTCRADDGSSFQVFRKCGAAHRDPVFGHKGGVPYEVEVYRRVLRSVQLPLAKFIGSDRQGKTHHLLLEALDGCERTHTAADPDQAMISAARWIGQFHAQCTASRAKRGFSGIIRYDRDYFLGWAKRTESFSQPLHKQFPWVPQACRRFESFVGDLIAAPQCVIHGEYYPKNILWRDGISFPVDWESAAIAPGEIDLASLTEGWAPSLEHRCEREYCAARWDGPPPELFQRRLAVARLYLTFRWLGDRPQWTLAIQNRKLFHHLRSIGEGHGLQT